LQPKAIADAFSNYFHSIADTITNNSAHNKTGTSKDITSTPLYSLSQISKNSFHQWGLNAFQLKQLYI
jgi:hypothetical protein